MDDMILNTQVFFWLIILIVGMFFTILYLAAVVFKMQFDKKREGCILEIPTRVIDHYPLLVERLDQTGTRQKKAVARMGGEPLTSWYFESATQVLCSTMDIYQESVRGGKPISHRVMGPDGYLIKYGEEF